MENKIFPGRDNYTGPKSGFFGLLHHDQVYEKSDNVMERVVYVKENKPQKEIAIRLYNMIYLDPAQVPVMLPSFDADYMTKRTSLDAEILVFIREQIPDCAWGEKELIF